MGTPDKKLSDLVDIVRSWVPRRSSEPTNVSRDFWMPDQSCRVCYECDSQFTVFNRRHHCRLCGRVFCAKCTANSIPALSNEPRSPRTGREDCERIRVCSYCYKQWEQGTGTVDNGAIAQPSGTSPGLSPSPSATSLASSKSSCTCQSSTSTVESTPYSTGPYQHVPSSSSFSPHQPAQMDSVTVPEGNIASQRSTNLNAVTEDSLPKQYSFCSNRSEDEDDDYGLYHSDSESRHFSQADGYYGAISFDEIDQVYRPHNVHPKEDNVEDNNLSCSAIPENYDVQGVVETAGVGNEDDERGNHDEREASSFDNESANVEPVDYESNALLWIPPEPEDEEDDREAVLLDDDEEGVATGEWGYLRPSNSFGSGEYRSREKTSEEHRNAMKNVVEGHFRALVAQLLQVENLPVGDEDDEESWLEIVTSLSWEAATILKPDMSQGGGMDPGGYVKVKCIACGRRSQSMVVKGVVCKKNVAHRRMTTRIDKPRFLILGGALEYQRVSNLLSSFDTLLQQEMDHLKMAVAKIDAHHPDVLLVEKSVSRYAQEYLLAKNISLVLNIKRPLLERIARCTGAQIVSSVDHLASPKLGHCDVFHVEKLLEEHGSAGQGGKKLIKNLMFFEGCPKPLGCTILLKGASGDELKKVKHVVQYGVFAAYHLALETSFLADEGATLPELPLRSPINVALPDKPPSIDRSISTVAGYSIPATGKPPGTEAAGETGKSNKCTVLQWHLSSNYNPILKLQADDSSYCVAPPHSPKPTISTASSSPLEQDISACSDNKLFPVGVSKDTNTLGPENPFQANVSNAGESIVDCSLISDSFGTSEQIGPGNGTGHADGKALAANPQGTLELASVEQNKISRNEGAEPFKEEFPPSPSDHQSILVFLSTRCVWKGTVCERPHLLRIKYYGNFDKPLGRFLRDQLFDQSYHCRSCGMTSEAHVHCYTHRQGSLTISVKKLPEFLLPGEKEGKIWMWHRCLRCPRTNGFPPATRRVVMSDAAWGLSFGKFLELSFSNHAAASRVASCGHSLHRDCLRFYGFGRMVACFRYASIDLHSVYLPPPKLEFYNDDQEWIQKEANEVRKQAELLFTEVQNVLHQFLQKMSAVGSQDAAIRALESRLRIVELEGMLQKEKEEFEESLQKAWSREVKASKPAIDILEINKLRRRILFHSYVWDQRLIHAANTNSNHLQESLSSTTAKIKEKSVSSVENITDMDLITKPVKGFSSCDSFPSEMKLDIVLNQHGYGGQTLQPGGAPSRNEIGLDQSDRNEDEACLSSGANINNKSDPLETVKSVRRAHSDGEYPIVADLSDTLDAVWTGEYPTSITPKEDEYSSADSTVVNTMSTNPKLGSSTLDEGKIEATRSVGSATPFKSVDNVESSTSMSFLNFNSSVNKNLSLGSQKLCSGDYNPVYVSLFRELERRSGARLLLPVGINDTVVPVYDDEPTSIIAYTLVSSEYHSQMSESEKPKDVGDTSVSLPLFDSTNLLSLNSFDESIADAYRSFGSSEESILSLAGPRSSQVVDPPLYSKDVHARVSFTDDGPLGKVKYTVTCYYAKRFEALRRICCPSELDFVRSLGRCKKWGAQGGKSNVFFAKTLDDRFIIKQVTKTELESFIKFGPAYFKYFSESISSGSPTCLAKILGIYQVSSKHVKGGKESKMDVLVMENLLFRRNVTRLYDLKGSSRSRYNPDTSGSNKVLLDQNLIEAMPTSPIFVGNKAKRLLERAVWNDTGFLAAIDVMDYSLLVGVDEKNHELVLGIIDFMRQYTWDKHLETWVKTSGFLGGPKNTSPTVISPDQYKKRFRKAMTAYFLMVPDQWFPPTIVPSGSQSDLCEETCRVGPVINKDQIALPVHEDVSSKIIFPYI